LYEYINVPYQTRNTKIIAKHVIEVYRHLLFGTKINVNNRQLLDHQAHTKSWKQ